MKKLLLFLALICMKQVDAQLCFNPVNRFWTGGSFYFFFNLANADFNGDGKKDLAMSGNYSSNGISVFLGTGTGSFGPPTSFALSYNSLSLISADFNGDGKADLASCDYNLSILLGTGTGSFGTPINFAISNNSISIRSIISADFNGDTKADLALLSDSVIILLGTGTGGFSSIKRFAAVTYPNSLTCADFNKDGKADLVTTTYFSNNLSMLFGTGTGSFGTAIPIPVGATSGSIASADFNGDTNVDLAVGTDSLVILLGNGTGSFGTISKYAGVAPDIIADFNGDGKMDLAGKITNYGKIPLCLGTGTGSFGAPVLFAVKTFTSTATCADFNGDGKPDFAVAGGDSIYGSELSVLLSCTGIGIANFANEQEIVVYPNPASNSISINIESISDYQNSIITIQNTLGETVKKLSFTKNIDVSDLPQGCYFLQITLSNGEIYKAKFIKQ